MVLCNTPRTADRQVPLARTATQPERIWGLPPGGPTRRHRRFSPVDKRPGIANEARPACCICNYQLGGLLVAVGGKGVGRVFFDRDGGILLTRKENDELRSCANPGALMPLVHHFNKRFSLSENPFFTR